MCNNDHYHILIYSLKCGGGGGQLNKKIVMWCVCVTRSCDWTQKTGSDNKKNFIWEQQQQQQQQPKSEQINSI